jgi:hypothetical protein
MDISWLIEQFSRRSPVPADADAERNVRSRLVSIALDGLRPGSRAGSRTGSPGSILPGEPPSPVHYVQRWSRTPGRSQVAGQCDPM